MADSVARLGVNDAEAVRHRLQIAVHIPVSLPQLEHQVIRVGHGKLRLYPRLPHGLKLEIRHGAQ